MKFALSLAASAAVLAAAAPALADGPEVRIRDAVARVVVVVEDRADIAVEVEQGRSSLPAITVSRRGAEVLIDGQLKDGALRRSRIAECYSGDRGGRPGDGASVEVRGLGRVSLADAPLIVVRTPRTVDVAANGAVFGAVGRGATSLDLGAAGCGDWTVANVDGDVEIASAGSGQVRMGTSRRLEASLAGSGGISAGATGALEANIAGSGNIEVAQVDGPVEANIAGSGDILVRGGRAGDVEANIMGSGNVEVRGTVQSLDANVMGSGDVRVASVAGSVSRAVRGSGEVVVGR